MFASGIFEVNKQWQSFSTFFITLLIKVSVVAIIVGIETYLKSELV